MGLIFVISGKYEEEHPIKAVTNFSVKTEKTEGFYGGSMVSSNPAVAFSQMNLVKQYFDKENNEELLHVYVASPKFNALSREPLYKIGKQCAKYFRHRHNVFFAIHAPSDKEENVHIHFVINPVSFLDGSEIGITGVGYGAFKKYVEGIIGERLLTEHQIYMEKETEEMTNEQTE